jgi:NADH-quinone oxidoreductase subunit G
MEVNRVKIQIDGTFYEVKTDRNLLETCLALGFDIPYFCNHPALGSVGACRLCAVKKYTNADDKKGRIIMSCMEPVTEGMIISVNDQEVKAFRAAVIEGLMTNHPHDCPICDEGGECHLQDMTVMTGHNYRQFEFKKRTYNNQDLGPFIQHEMNRCIQCYRCVRFYRDYAGGKDLNVFGSSNRVYFGRQKDGVLVNEFSGNLIEVCPTGVFTDKTLKNHYARKWDMTNTPSICVHCSLGCNIIISERYGTVRRIMSRYNGSVNGYFICDRGRFGYEFINNPERVKTILIRQTRKNNFKEVKEVEFPGLSEAVKSERIIGIGSPRASLESNFALSALVGKDKYFDGVSVTEHKLIRKAVQILESGIAHSPSLKEIEECDAILILGEDVTNTAPMLALALRQAARIKSVTIAAKLGIPKWNDAAVREMDQHEKSPVFIATPFGTGLDEIAEITNFSAPEDIARFGYAIAYAINAGAPVLRHHDKSLQETIERIAETLTAAKNPLIVTGITLRNEEILDASFNIAAALSAGGKKPSLSITFPECNSTGLAILDGNSLDDALELIDKNKVDTLVILENDLYSRTTRDKVDSVFGKCRQVIVIDHLMNETAKRADILLPAATFAESAGTIVNNEGRAQRFYSVLPANEPVKESWRWISDMAKISEKNSDLTWKKFDDVVISLIDSYPIFSGIKDKMTFADFRFFNEKIARQNKRFSGRTAMNANISVSEPGPPEDYDSPLNFSMEGYKGSPPSALIPYYWSPGWNSSQSMFKYMVEPDGHLKEGGDPGFRIFDNKSEGTSDFYKKIPEPFKTRPDELLIVPVLLIFGSEELSSEGEAVKERIPEPFILLNEKEITRLKLTEYELFPFSVNETTIKAIVKKDNTLPDGIAGISCLTRGIPYMDLPAWGRVLNTKTD